MISKRGNVFYEKNMYFLQIFPPGEQISTQNFVHYFFHHDITENYQTKTQQMILK